MSEKIKEIAEKRKYIAVVKERVEAGKKLLEGTQGYKDLQTAKDRLTRLEFDLKQEEVSYKVECVMAFKETGEMTQPGGQVKQFTVLEYDQDEAKIWAMEHEHAELLKLNKREFDKVGRLPSLKPDFVTATKVSRMNLSADLSEWLEESDE